MFRLLQGGEKYQQSFYVFEELAQAPATTSIVSIVSQAVSELHLGRVEEAQAALESAMQKEPKFAEAIANLLVLTVVTGKEPTELTAYVDSQTPYPPLTASIYMRQGLLLTLVCVNYRSLKAAAPKHPLLVDLEEKGSAFDKAAAKFSPKVSA